MSNKEFNILIIEDDKSSIDVLNKLLCSEYRIFIAKTGKRGLNIAENELPDLILLDLLLPDMNGFNIIKNLKSSDRTKSIPIICITGLSNPGDEEKGLTLGAVDYIMKPFTSSIVKARVHTHLQIVKQIRTIEKISDTDALTNIGNRRSCRKTLSSEWNHAIRKNENIGLLMIDIDKFKNYNDTYGHPQGDALLKNMAATLKATLKRPTDVAFRLGGEEFVVLLPNTDLSGAVQVAENIRLSIEKLIVPLENGNLDTSVTVSIGVVSSSPMLGDNFDDAIQHADNALYRAKDEGRNRVIAHENNEE